MERFDLYRVDLKYIRNLSQKEHKIMSVSPQIGKENRPFLGIVIMLNHRKYCIPITSADKKDKFTNNKVHGIDCIKILDESRKDEHGAPLVIAALNINNMIPVHESLLQKIDISTDKGCPKSEIGRRIVMQKELKWCRANFELIQRRTRKVYDLVLEGSSKNRRLLGRCNNFRVLEQVLDKLLSSKGVCALEEKNAVTQPKNLQTTATPKAAESHNQEPFYFGKKAILGYKPSSKQQAPAKSQERNKHNHRNNNNLE